MYSGCSSDPQTVSEEADRSIYSWAKQIKDGDGRNHVWTKGPS